VFEKLKGDCRHGSCRYYQQHQEDDAPSPDEASLRATQLLNLLDFITSFFMPGGEGGFNWYRLTFTTFVIIIIIIMTDRGYPAFCGGGDVCTS